MAVITSHTLNGVDGTHAGGIPATVRNAETGEVLARADMDAGGRFQQEVAPERIDPAARYELVFETAAYWSERGRTADQGHLIEEIVLRFHMRDPGGRYHLPVILTPNSYSTWRSA